MKTPDRKSIAVKFYDKLEVKEELNFRNKWNKVSEFHEDYPIYESKEGEILSLRFNDGSGIYFGNKEDYLGYKDQLIIMKDVDGQLTRPFFVLSKKQLNEVVKGLERSFKYEDENIYKLHNSTFVIADVYLRSGELYHTLDDLIYNQKIIHGNDIKFQSQY